MTVGHVLPIKTVDRKWFNNNKHFWGVSVHWFGRKTFGKRYENDSVDKERFYIKSAFSDLPGLDGALVSELGFFTSDLDKHAPHEHFCMF